MQWLEDVSPAEWIAPTLHPWFSDLGMILPPSYEAYARIFHPIREVGRWSELAARNGRVAHADMQLHLIATPRGEAPTSVWPDEWQVVDGSLPPAERAVLVEHLRRFTPADDIFLALWHGYGDSQRPDLPTFVHPHREYHLARGVLDDALPSLGESIRDQAANMWWPVDRTWFVATEIDYAWTYVGGSAELVEALVVDERLEAWAVDISHRPFADGDTLN